MLVRGFARQVVNVACWLLVGGLVGCGSRSGLDASGLDLADDALEEPGQPAAAYPDDWSPDDSALAANEVTPTGCVDITRSYASTPPTVLLLIDQSASMGAPFGTSTRWDVLREAIVEPERGLLAWLDAGSNVGLMLYTSDNGSQGGRACPLLERVDIRLGNADAIRSFYADAVPFPRGDTPTGEAVDAATNELLALGPGPAKYILLVTDGVPDTCAQPNPQYGSALALEAVQRAYAEGIVVRSVGVSPAVDQNGLQALANAGVGKAPELKFGEDADAEEPLYASTEPRELAGQLRGVIGDVRSCNVELGERVGRRRARDGRFVLDGVELEYGGEDGWTFVDGDTVLIHGSACQRILRSGQRLEVTFPCENAEPSLR